MKFKSAKISRYFDANGFTLIGVLMLLVLITVLGIGILSVTGNSLKLSANERTDQSTFYIAEAGIVETTKAMEITVQKAYKDAYDQTFKEYKEELEKYNRRPIKEQTGFVFDFAAKLEGYYLSKVKTELSKLSPRQLNSFETTNRENNTLTKPVAKVNVKIDKEAAEELNYKITSVGTIGNKERTVSQNLVVNLKVGNLGAPGTPGDPGTPGTPGQGGGPVAGLPENTAIIVKNGIRIKSSTVIGNIATLITGPGSIAIDWGTPTITGSFYVPSGSEKNALTKPSSMAFSPKVNGVNIGSIPELPSFPTPPKYNSLGNITSPGDGTSILRLQNNASLGTLKVPGSHKLTIDIGDTDKELVLDNLDISGSAQVIINGTGKLTLHVKNQLYITGSGKFNVQSTSKNAEIFYSGNEVLGKNFGGGAEIYASIYAQKANVEIASSTRVHGNILSGGSSFVVYGEGKVLPSLYFAPNANFEVRNSGKVTGTIIGNSISMEGEGLVQFGEPQYNTWVPGTPSTPSTPGTPPSMAENPNLTKKDPLIEN